MQQTPSTLDTAYLLYRKVRLPIISHAGSHSFPFINVIFQTTACKPCADGFDYILLKSLSIPLSITKPGSDVRYLPPGEGAASIAPQMLGSSFPQRRLAPPCDLSSGDRHSGHKSHNQVAFSDRFQEIAVTRVLLTQYLPRDLRQYS